MEKFESQFEDMDGISFQLTISLSLSLVQTSYMESSIGQSTAMTTPQEQVDDLIQQVADENGLEMSAELPGASDSVLKVVGISLPFFRHLR